MGAITGRESSRELEQTFQDHTLAIVLTLTLSRPRHSRHRLMMVGYDGRGVWGPGFGVRGSRARLGGCSGATGMEVARRRRTWCVWH